MSVIVPVFNAARYVGEALESIRTQSHGQLEIVVVDDGSTDDTTRVVAEFDHEIRYYRQDHSGAASARNHGVRVAQGQFLAFLDADDLWERTKLAKQLAAFAADPELDIVSGHVVQFSHPEPDDPYERHGQFVSQPMEGYHPGAMLVQREAFDAIGPFSEDQLLGDFIDWYARARDQGRKMLMLPDVVMRRRLHETNTGRTQGVDRDEYARVLRRVIERRRNAPS